MIANKELELVKLSKNSNRKSSKEVKETETIRKELQDLKKNYKILEDKNSDLNKKLEEVEDSLSTHGHEIKQKDRRIEDLSA